MFTTLLESSPRRSRSLVQGVVSVGLHAALGVGAVWATATADREPEERIIDDIVLPLPDRPAAPPPPPEMAAVADPAGPLPSVPIFVSVPREVPDGIPPVDLGGEIDPRRFVVGEPRSGCIVGCAADSIASSATFVEATVDEPARLLSQPEPVYPPVLRAAGIAGRVVVEFVVDTLGAVEQGTMRILESSNAGFVPNAKHAVVAARFEPARIGGRPVRQLVRQGISFTIAP